MADRRVVVIAVDASEHSHKAFDCKFLWLKFCVCL